MKLPVILAIIGIFVLALTVLAIQSLRARRKLKPYYSVIWKKSASLNVKDVLCYRPYNEYYFERDEDAILKRCLERRSNVLIVGPPLSGKSRAVYELLKHIRNNPPILIPRSVSMNGFVFPEKRFSKGKGIIFIDDLHVYAEKQGSFHLLFSKAAENKLAVIAVCRPGRDFKMLCDKLEERNLDAETLFTGGIIELGNMFPETGKQIALKSGMEWDLANFDGTIGSIFMKLSIMEKRYETCSIIEKNILQSLLMLNASGLFSDCGFYDLTQLKLTAASRDIKGKNSEWAGWLKSLEQKEFVRVESRRLLYADDTLLQRIVKKHSNYNEAGILDGMIEIFRDNAGVLVWLCKRAYDFGAVKSRSVRYMKAVINSCNYLFMIAPSGNAELILNAYKYRGLAYWRLSSFEDAAGDMRKALADFNEAVKMIDKNTRPEEYADLQIMRGRVFSSLAAAKDTEKNCLKAIRLFNESLESYPSGTFSTRYAQVYFHLGAVYLTLGKVKNPLENFRYAAEHLKKAIGYLSAKKYPEMYAETLNTLGNAYYVLADLENKTDNLKLALECFKNLVGLLSKEKEPIAYSSVLTYLGYIHSRLAAIEDTYQNCESALGYLNEALEIRPAEKFPIQYADIQYWIGLTNLTHAGQSHSAEQCHKAIDAFEKSLSVFNSQTHALHFAFIKKSLGDSFIILAELNEDRSENYRKSLAAYDEALFVSNELKATALYSEIHGKITKAKKIFF